VVVEGEVILMGVSHSNDTSTAIFFVSCVIAVFGETTLSDDTPHVLPLARSKWTPPQPTAGRTL
jgi:hypothetical protein